MTFVLRILLVFQLSWVALGEAVALEGPQRFVARSSASADGIMPALAAPVIGALTAETASEVWDLWVLARPSVREVVVYLLGAGPAAFVWTVSEFSQPVIAFLYDPLLHLVRHTPLEGILAEYQVWWADLARRFTETP